MLRGFSGALIPLVVFASSVVNATWLVNSETVARYVNKAAPTGGSVKTALIKPGSLLKVVAKSLGDMPIDISTPPTGPITVTEAVFSGGQEYRHCTTFSGCVHKSIAGGMGYKLMCSDATSGGAACQVGDIPITGTKLVVVDKLATASKAKIVFVAKDPAITKGATAPLATVRAFTAASGDPDLDIEARVDVAYNDTNGTFLMPELCSPEVPCMSGCFRDDGNGTIQDTCTGLQWEKKTSAPGSGSDYAELHDVDNYHVWSGICRFTGRRCQPTAAAEALCTAQTSAAYVEPCEECPVGEGPCDLLGPPGEAVTTVWEWLDQVRTANFAGHNDWRLPSEAGRNTSPTTDPRELESILLAYGSCVDPCIDPIFGPTKADYYWSTQQEEHVHYAWIVGFYFDSNVGFVGMTSGLSVRAVRGSP